MIAVLFEVEPKLNRDTDYFDIAAELRPSVETIDGFISIERFSSVTQPGKLLSLSFWRDEAAIQEWRRCSAHKQAQDKGKNELFASYRIRVANVIRDYDFKAPAAIKSSQRADPSHQ
jgi:heme-degrading monooxygenase HmoA